jgi:hypothetical protein
VLATAVTFGSQVASRGPWLWWSLMTAGLVVTLLCAWSARPAHEGRPAPLGQVPVPLSGSVDG